jgi:hypothetical protein
MASADPSERPEVQPINIPCRHLRNKGMYVYTNGLGGEPHEDYDNTIFWCLKTMKGFGPDDDLVSGEDCRNAARSCYEPI